MIRVFLEEAGMPGRVVLELRDLHCQNRAEVGPVKVASWHGTVVSHDVDALPMEGAVYHVVDGTGTQPMVFTSCSMSAFKQDSGFELVDGSLDAILASGAKPGRTHPRILVAFSYQRAVSHARWSQEQEHIRLDTA